MQTIKVDQGASIQMANDMMKENMNDKARELGKVEDSPPESSAAETTTTERKGPALSEPLHVTHLTDLSEEERELMMTAACLGSFDTRLLEAALFLDDETQLSTTLTALSSKGIIQKDNENNQYKFANDTAEQELYSQVPPEERLRIGRNLIQYLSQEELEEHVYVVLLQFHCAISVITNPEERVAIAMLCLRATHSAVSISDFEAACHYSDFGIQLLQPLPNHWKDEYDLSLALYNVSAQVFHWVANYAKVDELVSSVLQNAQSFSDSLSVRATRVHSLTETNRMSEALEEGLDILNELGVKFPRNPRKRHVAMDLVKTKRLLLRKTNEMILRMPLMDNEVILQAMQMLNLIFPAAYHIDRTLFALINLRLVILTMQYGLSSISSVGFAGYAAMLVALSRDKEKGYKFCELALDLLEKFGMKEYIPRTYFFVYAEAYTFKCEVRDLRPYLLEAYEIGLETGDIQYALKNSTLMEFGYLLFSGDSILACEEKMVDYYKTAVNYKQDTVLLIICPCLKFLRILSHKVERPLDSCAFSVDLDRAQEGKDEFSVWAIHFMQTLLYYIFGDYDAAANEAKELGANLRAHVHPGFSGVVTIYCLSLLGAAANRNCLSRRRLLSEVRRHMKTLEQFSRTVPDNCLHKFNLVQAELAVVTGNDNLAHRMYTLTISQSSELGVSWIEAIASERFAIFLENQGDKTASLVRYREAHSAYKRWGALEKVKQLEEQMPLLFREWTFRRKSIDETVESSSVEETT